MKKKAFSLLIAVILALSVLQLRAPIARADDYTISNFSINPDSGTAGQYVTISFSGTLFDDGVLVTLSCCCEESHASVTLSRFCEESVV